MAKITYIEHGGTEHVVDVANGLTVMELRRIVVVPVRAQPATYMFI
jgi:2Fe-2S ferredoxin